MRLIVLLAVLGLSACGTSPSMEELEQQAMISGDWSEVEKRERMMMRREARRGPRCADDQISYCQTSFGRDRCACVARAIVRNTFEGTY
jgi:hypothetical protein